MSTASKVFLFLLFPTTLALTYLSMRTLKTWDAWRTPYVKYQQAIFQKEQQIDQLKREVAQLREELEKVFALRGQVWPQCVRKRVDANTQDVGLRVEEPNPPGLKANQVVYLFQVNGPHYLGEYIVTATGAPDPDNPDAPNVVLRPTRRLPQWLWNYVVSGDGILEIRETLPVDREDAFAGADEQRIRQLFPVPNNPKARPFFEASLNEYLRDGKELDDTADVPPERMRVYVRFLKDADDLTPQEEQLLRLLKLNPSLAVKDQVYWFFPDTAQQLLQARELAILVRREYRRPLRDYATLFDDLDRQLPVWEDKVQRAKRYLTYLQQAIQSAQQQIDAREELLSQRLMPENQRLRQEVAVVEQVLQELQERLRRYSAARTLLLQQNARLAKVYRQTQLALAQEIERRARQAAQAAVP